MTLFDNNLCADLKAKPVSEDWTLLPPVVHGRCENVSPCDQMHRRTLIKSACDLFPGPNAVQSRAHSESSGEFSLSMENEPWSNGSSPVRQSPSRRSSSSYQPPSDTSTPQHAQKQQHKGKASTVPIAIAQNSDNQSTPRQKDPGAIQDFWLTKGRSIRRGSGGKVTRCSSDSGSTVKVNPGLNCINLKPSCSKAETSRASTCSGITVLYVQGKSSSMSGCLNCFSTPLGKEGRLKGSRSPESLPRASGVISTAEGSSRRSSVTSDCRVKTHSLQTQASEESSYQEDPANHKEQPQPGTKSCEPGAVPPAKPPRDPAVVVPTDQPKSPVQESLFGSSFTFNSVFSNTIFSDSTTTTTDALDNTQALLCLSSRLVHNGPLESPGSCPNKVQNEQSPNAAAGLEEKNKPVSTA